MLTLKVKKWQFQSHLYLEASKISRKRQKSIQMYNFDLIKTTAILK